MNPIDKSFELRRELRRFVLGWLSPSTLALESARADLNKELKEHWEIHSIDVYELIQENWERDKAKADSTNNGANDTRFIVFIDPNFDVDWITKAELEPQTEHCIALAESVGAKRCKHLPREQLLEFRRLIGHAIVTGISGDRELSCKLADDAAQFLKDRTVERSRSWTLTFSHILLLLFSVALAPLCLGGAETAGALSPGAFRLLALAVQGGLIGAYLSVVQKAGRGEWDAAAGRGLHLLEVFTKLLAGALLGGIAFVLSRSVNAPLSFKGIAPDAYSALILGIVAGLFERVIPKMISTYSEFEKQKNESK